MQWQGNVEQWLGAHNKVARLVLSQVGGTRACFPDGQFLKIQPLFKAVNSFNS
jgi:hypothetical protein